MPDQPWQAAALYCHPSSADPACHAQRRALAAHVEDAGHGVHSAHEEPHAGAEVARGAVLDLARAGHIEAILRPEGGQDSSPRRLQTR